MITYIKIDGFKSFKDFEMYFTPFTVIAGANASGKSNLFDALQLLSDLADDPLGEAFGKQRGNGTELFTQYEKDAFAERISFVVEMLVAPTVADDWGESEKLKHTRLRYELDISRGVNGTSPFKLNISHEKLIAIRKKDDTWIKSVVPKKFREGGRKPTVKKGGHRTTPYIETIKNDSGVYVQVGRDGIGGKSRKAQLDKISRTMLSGMDSVRFAHACAARQEISSWRFLALNTSHLRQPTLKEAGFQDSITSTGRNLAAALYRIQKPEPFVLNDLSRDMANLLPPITEVLVTDNASNNEYLIEVKSSDGKTFSSRVLSEGTLRLLALSIFKHDYEHKGLLCYEEPENGIHPGRISALVTILNDLAVDFSDPEEPLRQVIINTHSPIVINEVINLGDNHGASVWFMQPAHTAVDLYGKRYAIRITTAAPVVDESSSSKVLKWTGFSNNEKLSKLTLHQTREYLSISDSTTNILPL